MNRQSDMKEKISSLESNVEEMDISKKMLNLK